MSILALAIIAAALCIAFGLGVALGTKYGTMQGIYFKADEVQKHIDAHARLYRTMLDLGNGQGLYLKLVQKEDETK